MKKNILIAIVLCVFNSVAAFAQTEKEYSMVISLQNGSTITLGHNDIKNITFTGDNVSAEGNIVTSFADLQNQVNYLHQETLKNQEQINYVEHKYDKAFEEFGSKADKAYNDAVNKATEMKAEVEAEAANMKADMQNMAAKMQENYMKNLDFSYDNRARIEELQKQNLDMQTNAEIMKKKIEVLQAQIDQLKQEISDMKK